MSVTDNMESRPYADWFGHGDVKTDVIDVVKQYGEPLEVLVEEGGFMACVIYSDRVVVKGYDGNEYQHEFHFERKANKE